jgi:hypothetical protein
MKRLPNGVLILDSLDIIYLSFSAGGILSYVFRKYKTYKNRKKIDPLVRELMKKNLDPDPIVYELRAKSPVMAVSIDGKPLKIPPIHRGGDLTKLDLRRAKVRASLVIKNKRLFNLVSAIFHARKAQRELRFLQVVFAVLNSMSAQTLGLGIAVGGSLDYVQFLFIIFPSSIAGFLVEHFTKNTMLTILGPLFLFYRREIEEIQNPYEKCRQLCQAAEEFHNQELALKMGELKDLAKANKTGPLICEESPLSLVERYNLRKLAEAAENQELAKRIQYFRDFIKKFPECDADPESLYEEIVGTMKKRIKISD